MDHSDFADAASNTFQNVKLFDFPLLYMETIYQGICNSLQNKCTFIKGIYTLFKKYAFIQAICTSVKEYVLLFTIYV